MEFDTDQLVGAPYHPANAPNVVGGDEKCELRGYADRADDLQGRSSFGLLTNETSDRASVELNTCGLQNKAPYRAVRRDRGMGAKLRDLQATLGLFRLAATKLAH